MKDFQDVEIRHAAKFHDGQKLSSIEFADGSVHTVGSSCESITVILEGGQSGFVPWALVQYRQKKIVTSAMVLNSEEPKEKECIMKVNLALVESVGIDGGE